MDLCDFESIFVYLVQDSQKSFYREKCVFSYKVGNIENDLCTLNEIFLM